MDDIHVKVEQEEGCAVWVIAIVMIWIAFMLRGYMKQQLQPLPQSPVIEQTQEAVR